MFDKYPKINFPNYRVTCLQISLMDNDPQSKNQIFPLTVLDYGSIGPPFIPK